VNVNPELMFQNYLWVTGTTETARTHCQNLAKLVIEKSGKTDARTLEIGSNDGTLLQALVNNGATEVIGVDPAVNLQPKHLAGPITLFEGFFGSELAHQIASQIEKVDIVVARNVLSHVPNLNDVMQGIDKLVKDDGMVVIEFHDASKILTELHYESIYHEHTFYHSIRSIQAALSRIDFTIFDISSSPISGGSQVIYASREKRRRTPQLLSALELEAKQGVYDSESWTKFSIDSQKNLSDLRDIFTTEKASNWVAFGASARSSTLLNSIGESSKVITAIADNNPLKQGKYSPGLRIPIVLPESEINSQVEKVFICAFNFEDEIVSFLKNDLAWSGEVVLPLPSFVRRYKI
jgi:SAM-dependent methyltransferase